MTSTIPSPALGPYAPAITLSENVVLQLPLSQPTGAGILIFLPSNPTSNPTSDPDPAIKWAQQGFAVVAVTDYDGLAIPEALKQWLDVLQNLANVIIKDKFAVIVYAHKLINVVSEAASKNGLPVACFVGYGSFASPSLSIPIVLHLTANAPFPAHPPSDATTIFTYLSTSPFFVLPRSAHYDANSATQAHKRTLQFIQRYLLGQRNDQDTQTETAVVADRKRSNHHSQATQ